jgi:elongation factor G
MTGRSYCRLSNTRCAIAYDGKHHPVDSKEIAFITAGREAFPNALWKAKPIILEPIVKLEVRTLAECVGIITGDLSSQRSGSTCRT